MRGPGFIPPALAQCPTNKACCHRELLIACYFATIPMPYYLAHAREIIFSSRKRYGNERSFLLRLRMRRNPPIILVYLSESSHLSPSVRALPPRESNPLKGFALLYICICMDIWASPTLVLGI